MKRLLILGLLVFIPLVAGTITRTVYFSEQDLVIYQVNGYDVVEIKGQPVMMYPGAPRMPRVMQKLVIPANAVPLNVRITAVRWQEIPGTFSVVPAQPDVPLPVPGKSVAPEWVEPDPVIYASNESYPGILVQNSGMGKMSGYHIAHVDLFPVRYTPASGRLELATSITYEFEYEEQSRASVIGTERQKDVFGSAVGSIVVNPGDVARFAPHVQANRVPALVPPGYYEYVVVSAPPMDTVFERLAEWKTKKGIPATVVEMSWISSNYTGYDLAEKVRNFIIDAHDNWGTIYVLLGGSGDYRTSGQNIVPTRKAYYIYAGGPDGDSLPSDLYYGDLDGNWDFNGNHIYGQLSDNVDMYADVYVGRASVYNVAMAQNFLYKVFTYEKNPPTDYLKKMLLPTAILWSSYNERPMQDSIARMTPADWVDAKLYERNGLLSRQRMIDSMNVGFGMGHWVGHGDENGIYMGSSPYLNSADANALINGDRQGIANSIACMCGGWDLTPGSDCFAERLVNRVGGGLVAAMMNSRYGWGAYVGGYVPGPSERIDTSFYYNVLEADMFHIGAAHSVAKDAWVYYADSGNQYDMTRWCIYELNLFGDPEMPLWTEIPMYLTVNYPAAVLVGFQNINISVMSSGSPVNNALVCLHKGSEVYVSDYTNAAGLVTLSVNPTSPGAMYITVTAQNHYPFEDSLMVQPSNYAYITFLKCSISDPTPGGNNNNQLNPGENAQMPAWVMNWGQSQGNNIAGVLSTDDDYVTVSDTLKNFGNIPPTDSAYTGADGYDLSIANSCPNGHAVLFTLTCRDNIDSIWVSQFSLNVYAPVLTYQEYAVSGGNGNGILEPGETVTLVVTLENEGGAVADNVTSTLLTASPHITINDASGDFGTIAVGGTATNASDPYSVTADVATPYGTVVDFQVAVAAGVYADTLDFSLVVGQLVPTDTGYYYVYYSGGPHTYSPVFDWLAIDSTQTQNPGVSLNLGDDAVAQVNLPFSFQYYGVSYTQVTVSSNGWVCMGYQTSNYLTNYGIPNASGPAAMIAGVWDDLDPGNAGQPSDIYYYSDVVNHRFIIEYFRVEHYPSGGYETFEIILYDPLYYPTPTGDGDVVVQYLVALQETDVTLGIENAAQTVGIQYYFDGTYHELAVPVTDSFALRYTTYDPGYVGLEEYEQLTNVPVRTMMGVVYPNPFARDMRVSYQLAARGQVRLSVYDALGRAVCGLVDGMIEPGYYTVSWDGCDAQGRRVPAGVYFVKLETDGYQNVQKTVLLK
jgi:hypothetical protein